MGDYAFRGCSNIKTVYFPESLQTVSYYGFYGCTSITDVYYVGSSSDWTYVTIENGNDPIKNATFHYNYDPNPDATKPTVSITSTNNLATSQTVTLKMTDNVGVVSYYWGTSSSPSSISYTSITSATSKTVTKTVSSSGTYYLIAKDAAGNTATTSVTFYKTTFNSNGGSVSPSYVITKSGNGFTVPTPTKSDSEFVGWAVSSTGSANYRTGTTYKPSSNLTLYAVWETTPDPVDLGDVNGDGAVDAGDAVLISRYDAGFITLTSEQLEAGDVNGDGAVDAGDAVLISRYDAGFISSLN